MRRKTKRKDFAALNEKLASLKQKAQKSDDNRWESYECQLVTPMYGGGVLAGETDQAMPIRASAIRGHLRFWWRIACVPDNPEKLRSAEEAIWGGIGDHGAKASKVSVYVDCPKNRLETISTKRLNGRGVKYLLGVAEHTSCLNSGFRFTLSIRYPDAIKEDVETALRWWASFGGIGGRTRRGFGAIKIAGIDSISTQDMPDSMTLSFVSSASGKKYFESAEKAWEAAAFSLYKFRQGEGIGRNQGNQDKRPGRSYWPEPDQLRRMIKKHKINHEPEHPAGNAFPRAAFGMPIIFDFNDKTQKEPPKMTLTPQSKERMASPLIIRPYTDGDRWCAIALLLPSWQRALSADLDLSLTSQQDEEAYQKKLSAALAKESPQNWPPSEHERDELAKRIPPMNDNGRLRANDPLHAFLDFFEKG